jgi:hypothetical protein
MFRIKISSEDVQSVGYDRDNSVLEIELMQAGTFQYFNVPEKVYARFLNSKSYGDYFLKNIRGCFMERKVA